MPTLTPYEGDPFAAAPKLKPVEGNPFTQPEPQKLTPVEGNPFAEARPQATAETKWPAPTDAIAPALPDRYDPITQIGQDIGAGVSQIGKGLGELNPFTKDQPRDVIGGTLRTGKGLYDVAAGALGTVTAPFTGAARTAGNVVEKATGGLMPSEQFQTAVSTVMPNRAKLPGRIPKPETVKAPAPQMAESHGFDAKDIAAWSEKEAAPLKAVSAPKPETAPAGLPQISVKEQINRAGDYSEEAKKLGLTPPPWTKEQHPAEYGAWRDRVELLWSKAQRKQFGPEYNELHSETNAYGRGLSAPKPVGAEITAPAKPVGKKPAIAAIRSTEDDIFRTLRSRPQATDIETVQEFKALPPEFKDKTLQEKLYRFGEGEPGVQLNPQERGLFEKHVAPLNEENMNLWKEVVTKGRAAGIAEEEIDQLKELDPHFMHRMAIGKTKEFDQAFIDVTPQTQTARGRSLGTAPGLHEAVYHAIENDRGVRKLVAEKNGKLFSITDEGLSPLPVKGKPTTGASVEIEGQPWRIKRARTGEIEGQTGTKYYKQAWLSARMNNVQLKRAAEELAMVKRIKDDPAFAPFMTRRTSAAPKGWRETTLPAFKGYVMDPHIARVLDDISGAEGNRYLDALTKANRVMIGSLFWNPVPHLANVATHAYAANSWQNFNPAHWPTSLRNVGRAMKEVTTQGPLYQKMLKEGSSLIYSRVSNQGMWEDMLKGFGETIASDPEKTGLVALASKIGAPAADLVKGLYRNASKTLWAGGDVFMMHRVMELMDKGKPIRQAIFEAERDIPSYRVPSEIWQGPGGRIASEALRNQTFNLFGRYHYGVARGLAIIVKDLAVGDKEAKVDALGKALSLAALSGVIYPLVADPLVRAIMGADKHEGYTASRRGPTGPIETAVNAFTGKGIDWNGVARGAGFMASPVDQFIIALLANADWKGQKIVEPASPLISQLGQGLGWAAGTAVAPVAQVDRYLKDPDALRAFFADTIAGYKKPVPPGGWAATIGKRSAGRRAKKPNNVIEEYLRSEE